MRLKASFRRIWLCSLYLWKNSLTHFPFSSVTKSFKLKCFEGCFSEWWSPWQESDTNFFTRPKLSGDLKQNHFLDCLPNIKDLKLLCEKEIFNFLVENLTNTGQLMVRVASPGIHRVYSIATHPESDGKVGQTSP